MVAPQRSIRASGPVFELAIAAAWILLLLQTTTRWHPRLFDAGPMDGRQVALCAVTALGAWSCLCRAKQRAEKRLAWSLVGIGLGCYAAGFDIVFYVHAGAGPFGLQVSDWVSLPLYPLAFAGLVMLRSDGDRRNNADRDAHLSVAASLDGLIAALSVGAVIVAIVGQGHSALFHGRTVRVVYALAYPVGSLTLFAGALTVLALRQWRLEARWVLLLGGFGGLAVGDVIYSFQAAGGRFHFGTWLDAIYSSGPALVGLAAWRDARYRETSLERSAVVLAIPGLATLAALAVLVTDHVDRVPGLAIVLAGGGITLSVGRTLMFLRQERRFDRVRRDSLTDDLTGLANRRALERLLTGRLARDEACTLLVVDLDGFKEINDTLGHAAGDELLIGVASRLTEVGGSLQVARLGGDEFAVVVDGDGVGARVHADVVRRRIEEPISVGGAVVAVGASIGHAVSNGGASPLSADPLRAMTPGELLRRADVAMYRAKDFRTHIEMWAPTLDVGTRERLETMAALRTAIADPAQLVVFYQPQFDGRSMRLIGVEALARWQHPTRGLLGPGEFVPAAERTGLLSILTDRVLQESLAQIRRFADAGYRVPVSVNVTAPDLLDLAFADHVAAALESSGVAPGLLRLEITETVVMTDPQRVIVALTRLRELGVLLSLDDYGTGLSSLSYLQLLPVDELKIDRGFVSRITTDAASAVIVNSTIDLAHALHLTVVAEGVEDPATLDALCDASCDSVQGFLLGRPVPADSLWWPAWLERGAFVTQDHPVRSGYGVRMSSR